MNPTPQPARPLARPPANVLDVMGMQDWFQDGRESLYVRVGGTQDTSKEYHVPPDRLEEWIEELPFTLTREQADEVRDAVVRRPPRTAIVKTGRDLTDLVAESVSALKDHNKPPVVFQQGRTVTEVRRSVQNVMTLVPVTQTRMGEHLADVAEWVVLLPNGVVKPTKPDGEVARTLLESPKLHLPQIEAVTEIPVLRPDGRFTRLRGYDPVAKVYFASSARLGRLDIPEAPTRDDVRDALRLLDEMVCEFPWVDRAVDKVNFLAFMLTPILRPVIDGPTPMAAVVAPKAGTGKTLLVDSAARVLTGGKFPPTGLGADNDEAEKRLTAAFLGGAQFLFLDNASGSSLNVDALKRAITAESWRGRIITTSKEFNGPIRVTWAATGNNLSFDHEMVRRVYLIGLDAEMDHPEDRTGFRHNLDVWVPANRTRLLSALMTLISYWAAAGQPLASDGPALGSFESWSAVVGGVLEHAGLARGRFLGNEARKRAQNLDDEGTEWEVFCHAVFAWRGVADWTTRELTAMGAPSAVVQALPETDHKKLGYAVRSKAGGVFGPYRINRVGKDPRRGGAVYRITTVAASVSREHQVRCAVETMGTMPPQSARNVLPFFSQPPSIVPIGPSFKGR